jgi:hypothetical protein
VYQSKKLTIRSFPQVQPPPEPLQRNDETDGDGEPVDCVVDATECDGSTWVVGVKHGDQILPEQPMSSEWIPTAVHNKVATGTKKKWGGKHKLNKMGTSDASNARSRLTIHPRKI